MVGASFYIGSSPPVNVVSHTMYVLVMVDGTILDNPTGEGGASRPHRISSKHLADPSSHSFGTAVPRSWVRVALCKMPVRQDTHLTLPGCLLLPCMKGPANATACSNRLQRRWTLAKSNPGQWLDCISRVFIPVNALPAYPSRSILQYRPEQFRPPSPLKPLDIHGLSVYP